MPNQGPRRKMAAKMERECINELFILDCTSHKTAEPQQC